MKKVKKVKLDNLGFQYFKYERGFKEDILIITGWPSKQIILDKLIENLKYNVISFDYIGYGANSTTKVAADEHYDEYPELSMSFVNRILEENNISKVAGISAGSVFLARYINELNVKDKEIYYIAPQFIPTSIDMLLSNLFKGFRLLEKRTGKLWLRKFLLFKPVQLLWMKVITHGYKKEDTYSKVLEGPKSVQYLWSTTHFIEFYRQKQYLKNSNYQNINNINSTFLIGLKDNILPIKKFYNIIDSLGISRQKAFAYQANHVLENEVPELISFHINK